MDLKVCIHWHTTIMGMEASTIVMDDSIRFSFCLPETSKLHGFGQNEMSFILGRNKSWEPLEGHGLDSYHLIHP